MKCSSKVISAMRITILFLIVLMVINCNIENSYSSKLDEYFVNSSIPAAMMGYVDNNGVRKWKAFGPSKWGKTDTISKDNLFRIHSLAKAIISVGALQLVEKGLITLDEPLNKLMPEMISIPILNENGELIKSDSEITLHHLLTHTAGFGYDFTSTALKNFNTEDWKYEDMPRLFEPGKRWHYGTSTNWVGKLIEKLTGKTLEIYLRENITGPLKMNSTWYNVPSNLEDKIVSWGTRDSSKGFLEFALKPKSDASFNKGASLFSSPNDYMTFLECMLNDGKFQGGQLLKPETMKLIFENQLPEDMSLNYDIPKNEIPNTVDGFFDESDKFSFAWAIENNDTEKVRNKGAAYWSGAANLYYTLDKSEGIAIVYFTQFFPFNDKESYDFYRLYEKEVYFNHK
ncbi:serine hydrolase domain-containing protein [Psychroserpens algicola]|uniref:Beta-lactamase family protein n=1 Tax=Psychroserpens algicola TaxID=1719034 RepID=A0ABT0H609_9FLAO|nr:serine hydrolase domain-containing protein [Psychroserpens algicola]MCK8479810.1 beta-lactamase family protein [Psychroserpens algicola]